MDALVHATDKGKVGNLSQTIREYHGSVENQWG